MYVKSIKLNICYKKGIMKFLYVDNVFNLGLQIDRSHCPFIVVTSLFRSTCWYYTVSVVKTQTHDENYKSKTLSL